MKLRKAFRILRQAALLPALMLFADIEDADYPPLHTPDEWTKIMNPFMPLTDEVLLIGLKECFQEIKILKNYGRTPDVVESPIANKELRRKIMEEAHYVADLPP